MAVATATVAATLALVAAPGRAATFPRSVIVRARAGAMAAAERRVVQLGGRIVRPLGIIHGFTAEVPEDRLPALEGDPTVVEVSANAPLIPTASTYDPSTDPNSMAAITSLTGATTWWNAGYTGQGIDVAMIDSGVAPVEGLATPGKVIEGPDLSLESQNAAFQHLDTYGHGSFMAGLIAGHDEALTEPYADAPADQYRGMAPDARIVSLKVADADGGTDVSQVIAAIDWVVQHKTDNGMNIRVLSLSYGTNSTQAYQADPLAFAAEVAWKAGIVVVAAAGNTGYQLQGKAPGLADPAYDPYVIAVGASDPGGTPAVGDDTVAPFSASSRGCGTCKDPDFVGPGTSVQGLRVPNSWIDANHPEGRLDDRYFRGSGTSQATALTAGAVALVLQRYPTITPDEVKRFFTDGAASLPGFDSYAQGAGEYQLAQMLTATPQPFVQWFPNATGSGSLEIARGTDRLTRDGVVLHKPRDIFGQRFRSSRMAALESSAKSWSGGTWNGKAWSGDGWSGTTWTGAVWTGDAWSGKSWSSSVWSSNCWTGKSWSGSTWSGSSWSGSSWTGGTWAGGVWG